LAISSIPQDSRHAGRADRARELAMAAARVAVENRGRDVVVLDMREVSPMFDYFVIATGTSRRQLHAMSSEIHHLLRDDFGESRMGIEGYTESRWILLDYGDVVIHLFDDAAREYYCLEQLWSDASQTKVE
jgi:ribosome-associated protein